MASAYPEYVTDGHHIYLWHDEYESLFAQGKLKACEAPPPVVAPTLTKEEQEQIDAMRQKALREAELAIKMYGPKAKAVEPKKLEDVFGSEPKE